MLSNETKSHSYSAQCIIDEVIIANFTANIYGSGLTTTCNVLNKELYIQHEAEVKADYAEFIASIDVEE